MIEGMNLIEIICLYVKAYVNLMDLIETVKKLNVNVMLKIK